MPYVPIWQCTYLPGRGYSNTGSIVAVVFFEIKVQDGSGNQYWTNYIASDDGNQYTAPEFAACEKFNRWFYNIASGTWYQADSSFAPANYYTRMTTHDTCVHMIRAGWQFSSMNTWQTFTWDVGQDFRSLCSQTEYEHLVRGYINWHIIQGRVKAVIVSVEGYCCKVAGYCDWVTLTYTP